MDQIKWDAGAYILTWIFLHGVDFERFWAHLVQQNLTMDQDQTMWFKTFQQEKRQDDSSFDIFWILLVRNNKTNGQSKDWWHQSFWYSWNTRLLQSGVGSKSNDDKDQIFETLWTTLVQKNMASEGDDGEKNWWSSFWSNMLSKIPGFKVIGIESSSLTILATETTFQEFWSRLVQAGKTGGQNQAWWQHLWNQIHRVQLSDLDASFLEFWTQISQQKLTMFHDRNWWYKLWTRLFQRLQSEEQTTDPFNVFWTLVSQEPVINDKGKTSWQKFWIGFLNTPEFKLPSAFNSTLVARINLLHYDTFQELWNFLDQENLRNVHNISWWQFRWQKAHDEDNTNFGIFWSKMDQLGITSGMSKDWWHSLWVNFNSQPTSTYGGFDGFWNAIVQYNKQHGYGRSWWLTFWNMVTSSTGFKRYANSNIGFIVEIRLGPKEYRPQFESFWSDLVGSNQAGRHNKEWWYQVWLKSRHENHNPKEEEEEEDPRFAILWNVLVTNKQTLGKTKAWWQTHIWSKFVQLHNLDFDGLWAILIQQIPSVVNDRQWWILIWNKVATTPGFLSNKNDNYVNAYKTLNGLKWPEDSSIKNGYEIEVETISHAPAVDLEQIEELVEQQEVNSKVEMFQVFWKILVQNGATMGKDNFWWYSFLGNVIKSIGSNGSPSSFEAFWNMLQKQAVTGGQSKEWWSKIWNTFKTFPEFQLVHGMELGVLFQVAVSKEQFHLLLQGLHPLKESKDIKFWDRLWDQFQEMKRLPHQVKYEENKHFKLFWDHLSKSLSGHQDYLWWEAFWTKVAQNLTARPLDFTTFWGHIFYDFVTDGRSAHWWLQFWLDLNSAIIVAPRDDQFSVFNYLLNLSEKDKEASHSQVWWYQIWRLFRGANLTVGFNEFYIQLMINGRLYDHDKNWWQDLWIKTIQPIVKVMKYYLLSTSNSPFNQIWTKLVNSNQVGGKSKAWWLLVWLKEQHKKEDKPSFVGPGVINPFATEHPLTTQQVPIFVEPPHIIGQYPTESTANPQWSNFGFTVTSRPFWLPDLPNGQVHVREPTNIGTRRPIQPLTTKQPSWNSIDILKPEDGINESNGCHQNDPSCNSPFATDYDQNGKGEDPFESIKIQTPGTSTLKTGIAAGNLVQDGSTLNPYDQFNDLWGHTTKKHDPLDWLILSTTKGPYRPSNGINLVDVLNPSDHLKPQLEDLDHNPSWIEVGPLALKTSRSPLMTIKPEEISGNGINNWLNPSDNLVPLEDGFGDWQPQDHSAPFISLQTTRGPYVGPQLHHNNAGGLLSPIDNLIPENIGPHWNPQNEEPFIEVQTTIGSNIGLQPSENNNAGDLLSPIDSLTLHEEDTIWQQVDHDRPMIIDLHTTIGPHVGPQSNQQNADDLLGPIDSLTPEEDPAVWTPLDHNRPFLELQTTKGPHVGPHWTTGGQSLSELLGVNDVLSTQSQQDVINPPWQSGDVPTRAPGDGDTVDNSGIPPVDLEPLPGLDLTSEAVVTLRPHDLEVKTTTTKSFYDPCTSYNRPFKNNNPTSVWDSMIGNQTCASSKHIDHKNEYDSFKDKREPNLEHIFSIQILQYRWKNLVLPCKLNLHLAVARGRFPLGTFVKET